MRNYDLHSNATTSHESVFSVTNGADEEERAKGKEQRGKGQRAESRGQREGELLL